MWTAETVLLCALSMLGRSPASLPPVSFVATRPVLSSPHAEAFVRPGERRIYIITSSNMFRRAQAATTRCGESSAIRKLASVLVHEEYHIKHPGDEFGAYAAQLTMLAAMGSPLGHPVYSEVRRAMIKTLERQRQEAPKLAEARLAP